MVSICTTEYSQVLKKNKVLLSAGRWMNFVNMLSELGIYKRKILYNSICMKYLEQANSQRPRYQEYRNYQTPRVLEHRLFRLVVIMLLIGTMKQFWNWETVMTIQLVKYATKFCTNATEFCTLTYPKQNITEYSMYKIRVPHKLLSQECILVQITITLLTVAYLGHLLFLHKKYTHFGAKHQTHTHFCFVVSLLFLFLNTCSLVRSFHIPS